MGTGLKALGEKQVNFNVDGSFDGLAGTQADPAVTALVNGNFVVVYENPQAGGSNIDLLAHFFDASGNAIGPPVSSGLVNGVVGIDRTADVTVHPAVAATPNGGFVVAYTDATAQSIDVRRYDSTTGISAPFVIDSANATRHQPNVGPVDDAAIATFANGTSVVVWEFDFANSATDHDLYFAFLNSTANGFVQNPLPLAVQNSFEGEARVATSGNLGAIVYAADPGTINGGQDIILRLFNSSATEVAAPSTIFGTANSDVFSHPDVAALSDGRFVIVARDDTASALLGSVYDPVTHAVTPVFNFTGGTNPHVAGVLGGGFDVSFDNPTGDVVEDRFGPGGTVLFNADFTNSFMTGTQDQNAIATNTSGTVFFAWQDAGSGNPNSTDTDTRIEAQAFDLQLLPQSNFNGDGSSDILWQNDSGQAAIWLMFGPSPVGAGAVGPNPGPSWHVKDSGDFNGDGKADILWQNDRRDAGDLADEWLEPDRCRRGWRVQSGAELADQGDRRLQRRRQGRYSLAERPTGRRRSG